jgi:hypothetical protein
VVVVIPVVAAAATPLRSPAVVSCVHIDARWPLPEPDRTASDQLLLLLHILAATVL